MVSPVFLATSVDALTIMSSIPHRSDLQYMLPSPLDPLEHNIIVSGNVLRRGRIWNILGHHA